MSKELKTYSLEEIARHNKAGDCWVVVDGKVYDASKFADLHPGGRHVLFQNSGKDSSELFKVYHHPNVLKKHGPRLIIGTVEGYQEPNRPVHLPGSFGDMIPYGDPSWYQRFNSPYYKESHRRWRAYVRDFVEREVLSTMEEWKGDDAPPKDLIRKIGESGIGAAMCGPPYPQGYLPANPNIPDDFDYFHELIVYDEFSRCGDSMVIAALTNGNAIGLPVVLRFGTPEQKARVVPAVLSGEKYACLAISEPNAGSDVAGLTCSAVEDGDYWVINGNKKWITNGTYADYFMTAVRTGRPGELTFFLIERGMPGFTTRKLGFTGNSNISGTAYLDFDNCRVHKSCIIGEVNKGFKLVMHNFNHERFYIAAVVARLSRVCLEESIRYALRRKAFGKTISEIQSIRLKIASMARMIEQYQAWLELITYQMCTMTHEEANMKLGDVISLLKAQGSVVYEHCSRETTMVFGGNALRAKGPGQKIEAAVAQVKGYQIPAGAEDVMNDFGGRMAFKLARQMAKL